MTQMRAGVVTSAVIHAAVLTWGLWSLGAPKPLDAQYAEALPVEIVMSDTFEGVKGEKEAPITDKPAPKPTTRPQTLPMEAKNVGDNEVDLDSPPVPNEKPVQQEAKPQPKAADLPPPEPKPEPKPKVAEKAPPKPPEPKPEPKVAENTPPPEPKPEKVKKEPDPPKVDPLAEAIQKAEDVPDPKPEVKPQPKPVPKPAVKPTPPKVETADADADKPEPKKSDSKSKEKPKRQVADNASDEPSKYDTNDIMAQITKAKAAGGGAKRSTETASLGSKVTTGTKLSRSQLGELDGLIKEKMRDCWNPPSGIESGDSLRVSIRIRFDPSGEVDGVPEITAGGGSGAQRIAAEAAVRAIRRCAPFNLPAEMYAGGWEVTNLNFDPSEMF